MGEFLCVATRTRWLHCGIALLTFSWVPESTLLLSTSGVSGVYSARWLMDVHYSLVIQMLINFRKFLKLWVRRISRIGQQLLNCQIGSQTSKSSRRSTVPNLEDQGIDLMSKMLRYHPDQRVPGRGAM